MTDDATANEWDAVSNLIALILDVKACAERMAELRTAQAELDKLTEHHVGLLNDSIAERTAAAAALADARRIEGETEYWRKQCDAKELALKDREVAVRKRKEEADARERKQNRRDTDLGTVQTKINKDRVDLDARSAKVDEMLTKAEHQLAEYDAAKHAAAIKLAS